MPGSWIWRTLQTIHIQVSLELTSKARETDLLRRLVEPSPEHFGVGIASAFSLNHFALCGPIREESNIQFIWDKIYWIRRRRYHRNDIPPHWKCEEASRSYMDSLDSWLIHSETGSMATVTVTSKCYRSLCCLCSLCCLHFLDVSYLIPRELLQPRCSCFNLLTSPGQALNATSSMAQAASSSENFASSSKSGFSWAFHGLFMGFSWVFNMKTTWSIWIVGGPQRLVFQAVTKITAQK